ncbi:SCO4402 family protein [Pengzhenrongella sp.]|jgi:hypothetical protein|uniref:SCO4402 family protein n=1 Tax=Pengzhenrongella sp. TaxID=2888820 RepID=UPI002F924B83
MTSEVTFPEMRNEVIAALRSFSDPVHQATRWGRWEEGVNYYDDLTLNVNTLYDDCQVLPSPESAVPDVLLEADVPALRALDNALGPMIRDLGNRPDTDYLADPRWPTVVAAAQAALDAMDAQPC